MGRRHDDDQRNQEEVCALDELQTLALPDSNRASATMHSRLYGPILRLSSTVCSRTQTVRSLILWATVSATTPREMMALE